MDGFALKSKAFAFEFNASTATPISKDGFHVKPEAYAIITSEDSGFYVKPEIYLFFPSAQGRAHS